jgi:hypothetical protein
VRVELTDEGILIRPPEREHYSHDHASASSSGEQESVESEARDGTSSLLKVWQSLKSRFAHSSKRPNGDEK